MSDKPNRGPIQVGGSGQFNRPDKPMSADKLNEIRDDLLRRLHPCDFTSVSDYDKDRALIRAALDEAVDVIQKEEREAAVLLMTEHEGVKRQLREDREALQIAGREIERHLAEIERLRIVESHVEQIAKDNESKREWRLRAEAAEATVERQASMITGLDTQLAAERAKVTKLVEALEEIQREATALFDRKRPGMTLGLIVDCTDKALAAAKTSEPTEACAHPGCVVKLTHFHPTVVPPFSIDPEEVGEAAKASEEK